MPLTPHTGTLGAKKAAHLLRRCTFNVTPQRIRDFALLTATEAVEQLFDFSQPLLFPDGPIWRKDGYPIHSPEGRTDQIYFYINPSDATLKYRSNLTEPSNPKDPAKEATIGPINYLRAVDGWRMQESINDTSIRWKLVYWFNSMFTTNTVHFANKYYHWKMLHDFANNQEVLHWPHESTLIRLKEYEANHNINIPRLLEVFGSLKTLAIAVTYSNEMGRYLNAFSSQAESINENYAREFLELFTILKGDSPLPGDYTNYTEQDVVAASKILTGLVENRIYRVDYDFIMNSSQEPEEGDPCPYPLPLNQDYQLQVKDYQFPKCLKNYRKHDMSDKTFSDKFGSRTIDGPLTRLNINHPSSPTHSKMLTELDKYFCPDPSEEDGTSDISSNPLAHTSRNYLIDREIVDFVDMIFDEAETAKAYVRRMYRYFVSDKIDDNIESSIITPLSNTLQTNDYVFANTLKTLLKSKHFYEAVTNFDAPCNSPIGSKIKSPLELLYTSINLLEIENPHLKELLKNRTDGVAPYAHTYNYVDGQNQDGSDILVPVPDTNDGQNPQDPDIAGVFEYSYKDVTTPLKRCGFDPEGPPTVEGYPGYYKEDNYSKNWLDSSTFYNRYSFGKSFRDGKVKVRGSVHYNKDTNYKCDMVKWVDNNVTNNDDETPFMPHIIVRDMLCYLVANPPSDNFDPSDGFTDRNFKYFYDVFLANMTTGDWAEEWGKYKNSSDDTEVKIIIDRLFLAIMESHEFQTF